MPFPQELSPEITKLNQIIKFRKENFQKELEELCSKSIDRQESNNFVVTSDIPQEILDRDVIGEGEEIKPINRYLDAFIAHYAALCDKKIEEEEEKKEIDDLVLQMQKIYSFAGGANLGFNDQTKLVEFNSQFDRYLNHGQSGVESLREALQNGVLDKNQLKKDVKSLLSIMKRESEKKPIPHTPISTPSGNSLTAGAQRLKEASGSDMVRDMQHHYEREHDGNLGQKRDSFIELINHAKCKDGDINLSFQRSFFDQEFSVPYRKLTMDTICREWGMSGSRGTTVESYYIGCPLEKKLIEIINRWFPDVKAFSDINGGRNDRGIYEISTYIEDTKNMEKKPKEAQEELEKQFKSREMIEREVPVIRYMFCYHSHRFDRLIYGQNDRVSPKLFIQMLYTFEKEAKRLGVKPEDLNNIGTRPKDMNPEQSKLRDLWSEFKTALMGMGVGCSKQLTKMINMVAEKFDAYQSAQVSADTSPEKSYSLFDRKFCQVLREKATNSAVDSCPVVTKGGDGSIDYACKIKSIYVPLVNVIDPGYHQELRSLADDYGETYQTLAEKWKNVISSYDTIKETFATIYNGTGSEEQFNEFAKSPMTFDNFVSILKSIDKSDRSSWVTDIDTIYSDFGEYINSGVANDEEKEDFDKMDDWKDGKCEISFQDFLNIINTDLLGRQAVQNSKIYQLLNPKKSKDESKSVTDDKVIAYILHLVNRGMITING
ncbi:MAG: hypothetical protein Q4D57_06465 [Clostridia bacterium]|nr:hypothetical protein [Clostridia bacterium]